MKRFLFMFLLILGLFFAPWILVFAGSVFFTAVFSWGVEALIVSSVAAVIADIALWKLSVIFGSTLIFQEALKTIIGFEKVFAARAGIWTAGFIVFAVFFFVFI